MAHRADSRQWYRIEAKADSDLADVYIYDTIGEDWWTGGGVTAKGFLDELNALPEAVKTIRVHVNSPGGSVFDAVAIANSLRAQSTEKGRTVEMRIEALAASAASIVTSAGDRIKIANNALMMVHNPLAIVIGQAKDMREMAETLDTVRDSIVATYRWVSKLSPEEIQALMDATTWMDAEEAVKNGFATEVMEPVAVAAHFDPRSVKALGEIPERYRDRVSALVGTAEPASPSPPAAPAIGAEGHPTPPMEPAAVVKACTAAGCLEFADGFIEAKATSDEVAARIQRAKEIRGLCALAKCPELADGYIHADVPVDVVKGHLATLTAKLDKMEIDAHLQPDADRSAQRARLNPSAIYAERHARAGQRGA